MFLLGRKKVSCLSRSLYFTASGSSLGVRDRGVWSCSCGGYHSIVTGTDCVVICRDFGLRFLVCVRRFGGAGHCTSSLSQCRFHPFLFCAKSCSFSKLSCVGASMRRLPGSCISYCMRIACFTSLGPGSLNMWPSHWYRHLRIAPTMSKVRDLGLASLCIDLCVM